MIRNSVTTDVSTRKRVSADLTSTKSQDGKDMVASEFVFQMLESGPLTCLKTCVLYVCVLCMCVCVCVYIYIYIC